MINAEAFEQMKDGVIFLNFARDKLVNDQDLIAALNSGKVKKYVTDFPNDAVIGQKGVIALPHLGASSSEAEDNCAVMAIEQVMDYLENGNIVKDDNGSPIRIPKMTYYTTDTGGGVAFAATTETAASTVVIGGSGVNEDGSISIYAMSQEQADQILDLINATTAVYGYDESILNIISDEAAAYFAGEKSLDDTANMIQSRVNLYVAEQS